VLARVLNYQADEMGPMRKRIQSFAALAAAVWLATPTASHARDALGLWLTKDRDAKVRVSECGGGALCGTIVWLSEPIDKETGKPVADKMNPDPARRSRPMVGIRIFTMQPAGPNKWTGAIYNADDGKTYSGNVELLDGNRLKIQGCLGPFCDHEIWVRAN
jgi:uncharacterized protein (DUF2147 family)